MSILIPNMNMSQLESYMKNQYDVLAISMCRFLETRDAKSLVLTSKVLRSTYITQSNACHTVIASNYNICNTPYWHNMATQKLFTQKFMRMLSEVECERTYISLNTTIAGLVMNMIINKDHVDCDNRRPFNVYINICKELRVGEPDHIQNPYEIGTSSGIVMHHIKSSFFWSYFESNFRCMMDIMPPLEILAPYHIQVRNPMVDHTTVGDNRYIKLQDYTRITALNGWFKHGYTKISAIMFYWLFSFGRETCVYEVDCQGEQEYSTPVTGDNLLKKLLTRGAACCAEANASYD
jgi:hypothetical protein